MRPTKQKVRCLEIQRSTTLLYMKKGSNTFSQKKGKKVTSYLLNKKIFKIYHLSHKI
jgi:hypothetical protein